jgi:hypothetical protein
MTNAILWKNPTLSGLGDRFIDLFLLSTLASLYGVSLFVDWPKFDGDSKIHSKGRFEDVDPKNFCKYLKLPNNVKIIPNEVLNKISDNYFFNFGDYLGGVYSPLTFQKKYLPHINFDIFYEQYLKTISEFDFTDEFYDLVVEQNIPDVSVHLRRTDKLNGSDGWQIHNRELNDLNEKTTLVVEHLLSENIDYTLYFASDDASERDKYNNLFEKNKINLSESFNNYLSTYIDLYLMAKSKIIIMSQKHSNFSCLAAMIGRNKLIYMYENCALEDTGYLKTENFIYYKNYILR